MLKIKPHLLFLALAVFLFGFIFGRMFLGDNSYYLKTSVIDLETVDSDVGESGVKDKVISGNEYEISPMQIGTYVEENASVYMDDDGVIHLIDN